ncbi:MarR family winged helix-turn-helix transcriptional regulator [Microlunatus sp. Gsoil 973]|jgi:DNA-binding MarR family transcriptional regulator|uniref:MarR family winged helix-turn-helix transcriptional regulator n=1 Tax=Microlunatus sp. Gsoil 973 TaxID=2672569 RepID=UPI0012B4B3E7|nr:MarR family transcriptional regulator [Microlunatus sp. Gsoil 973]QGN32727.1 MarR family transcriptional regulator [Microlunatus sp. Gsoil 973]
MPIERDQAASLLEALVSLVRVTRTIAHRDAAHSVAATPIALLKLVSETDPRLGDLAEQLRVKPSVASRAVAALESQGYVRRIADPGDARACRVHITGAGRAYLRSREEWAVEMVARTMSDWSAEEAEMSVRVLQRLEQSVTDWVSHFDRAVETGTDPLAMPVPTRDGADGGPSAGPAARLAEQDDQTTYPDHHSEDDGVPADNPNAMLKTALTTWETTAV